MVLLYNGYNISRLLSRAEWSGDIQQAPRTLRVTLLWSDTDDRYPRALIGNIQCGDRMVLYADNGVQLFTGRIFDLGRTLGETTRTYTLYDSCIHLTKSDIVHNFYKTSPEDVARITCALVGVSGGHMASGAGLELSFAHIGKGAYNAILGAYTQVAQITQKEYYVHEQDGAVCVDEIGAVMARRTLSSSTDIVKASYTSNLDNAVTRVIVATSAGKIVDTISQGVEQYGILQKVTEPEKGEDPAAKAREMLVGPDNKASLSEIIGGPDALDLVAGNTVAVHEPVTGMYGVFYIVSDTHTFENAHHKVSLGLAFEVAMTKEELDIKREGSEKPKNPDPWAGAAQLWREMQELSDK
jgi:hypothetical protein